MPLVRSLAKEQEIIENQRKIIELLEKSQVKHDSATSKILDSHGSIADKLDRVLPEDSELDLDGKDF